MGKGIKMKDKFNARTASNESVIVTELTPQEMNLARIGSEITLVNGSNFNDGDYIEFMLITNAQNNTIVADKAQKIPNVKTTLIDSQQLANPVYVGKDEVVYIVNSSVQADIIINGGILLLESSNIDKIKDETPAGSFTVITIKSTVNDVIKFNTQNSAINFVAQSSIFNNFKFSNIVPVIFCLSECTINGKLTIK